jgi:hypothetical protein
MRAPAPLIGVFPGTASNGSPALNRTLLSVTCKRAFGVVVPIPTFPFWEEAYKLAITQKTDRNFFISTIYKLEYSGGFTTHRFPSAPISCIKESIRESKISHVKAGYFKAFRKIMEKGEHSNTWLLFICRMGAKVYITL